MLKDIFPQKLFITLVIILISISEHFLASDTSELKHNNNIIESFEMIKAEIECCKTLNNNISNRNLDNPEDSTTERVKYISYANLIRSDQGMEIECTRKVFLNLLKNDPYPQMRALSAANLKFPVYMCADVQNALIKALDDPHIMVRIEAANSLTVHYKCDSTLSDIYPDLMRLLKSAAIGSDRQKWNLKGFYTKLEFEKNPENTLEKCRDQVQQSAISGLNNILGKKRTFELIDSIEKFGATKEIRLNAQKGKKCWAKVN